MNYDEVAVLLAEVGETPTEQVAWAIHCWTCPLCHTIQDMAASGQAHVTEDDLRFASFLARRPQLHQPRLVVTCTRSYMDRR